MGQRGGRSTRQRRQCEIGRTTLFSVPESVISAEVVGLQSPAHRRPQPASTRISPRPPASPPPPPAHPGEIWSTHQVEVLLRRRSHVQGPYGAALGLAGADVAQRGGVPAEGVPGDVGRAGGGVAHVVHEVLRGGRGGDEERMLQATQRRHSTAQRDTPAQRSACPSRGSFKGEGRLHTQNVCLARIHLCHHRRPRPAPCPPATG